MDVKAYLHDAEGFDETVELHDINLGKLKNNQLLWINILSRDEKIIKEVTDKLKLEHIPLKSILDVNERPKLDKFPDFYRIFITSVETLENQKLMQRPVDFLVGNNFVITIHEGDISYFKEFRDRENGETRIGVLEAESFLAALLDYHIVSYFRALENIDQKVDEFDERILKEDIDDENFLREIVRLRADVSKLRRWFLPHRDVFYPLARPDFLPVTESESAENFQRLSQHFENAVDSIESSRDTVVSLFDLFTSKSAQKTNAIMQQFTFITFLVGMLGVIAGTLGMNFRMSFFENATGFWLTILVMVIFALAMGFYARRRRWI